jgi:hypothetical protein
MVCGNCWPVSLMATVRREAAITRIVLFNDVAKMTQIPGRRVAAESVGGQTGLASQSTGILFFCEIAPLEVVAERAWHRKRRMAKVLGFPGLFGGLGPVLGDDNRSPWSRKCLSNFFCFQ